MLIREFVQLDWPQVWPTVRGIVRAADTFACDPAMGEAEAHAVRIEAPPGQTVMATEDGRILGTAKMGPNRPGPGSHVATASFMVAAEARPRRRHRALPLRARLGRGARLCRHAVQCGGRLEPGGHRCLPVARLPHRRNRAGAFAHPTLGRVELHVMYCEL